MNRMSLANRITLARAALIPVPVVLLIIGQRTAAAVTFAAISAGDVLDGAVARARGEVTTLGKALDPAVDKALYLSVIWALVANGLLMWWWAAVFTVPQIAIGIGAWVLHARLRHVQGARVLGKLTAALIFTTTMLMISPLPPAPARGVRIAFVVAVGMAYVANVDYALTAFRALRSSRRGTPGTPEAP
jgi:CDP-diacylglycerol--glycerol-3-phosphate 3-phosphatidyltransferase